MDELDHDRALAYTRSHTFDGTVPDVAHDEDAGNIRFEQAGITVECPRGGTFAVPEQIGSHNPR